MADVCLHLLRSVSCHPALHTFIAADVALSAWKQSSLYFDVQSLKQTQNRTDTTQQDLWVDPLQNDSGIKKETYFSSVLCVGFEKQRENLLGQIMLNNSEQGPALSSGKH